MLSSPALDLVMVATVSVCGPIVELERVTPGFVVELDTVTSESVVELE